MNKSAFHMEYDWMTKLLHDERFEHRDAYAIAIGAIEGICKSNGKYSLDKIEGVLRALKEYVEG